MGPLLPFLLVLLAAAFFTKADLFFHLLYALVGIYLLGRWWARRSLQAVVLERSHDRRVFFGQVFSVTVELHNRSRLPVLWMRLSDTIPAELGAGASFRRVVSLKPRERRQLDYRLFGRRRGYYRLGPLAVVGGDLLGTATYEARQPAGEPVIVYPRIVPLRELGFPSRSPFGTLPSRQRIFDDPTRIQGMRDYVGGDSLRHVDWKTSARLGKLQVRRYEPAIALSTAILLNLSAAEYSFQERYAATELGIVIAASVAAHLTEKRQAVALATNGRDPLGPDAAAGRQGVAGGTPSERDEPPAARNPTGPDEAGAPSLPLRKGHEHLMDMLDLLARVEVAPAEEAMPFLELLRRKSLGLPWGSTVLVVMAREAEGLMDTLVTLRRRGLLVVLVCTCPDREFPLTVRRAEQIGVRALQVCVEREMDLWR